jgi:DNA-binding CsgD family transcriptional regulator
LAVSSRDDLTEREREVLALLRLGLTNEEIAGRLNITLDGAKYHVSQILSKLGVATREEAAAEAIRRDAPKARLRRRWWAAWPLAAKAAGAALVVAAVTGLGVLAWGVLVTEGQDDEAAATLATPRANDESTPSAPPTGSATQASTQSVTPPASTALPGRFDGVTMSFTYPADWYIADSVRPYFDQERGDENVVIQSFPPETTATEGLPGGAIKLDFSGFPLTLAATPTIESGYQPLAIDNPSGARFLIRQLEEGYWHIWGLAVLDGCFFFVSVLMNTEEPTVDDVEPILSSWTLRRP